MKKRFWVLAVVSILSIPVLVVYLYNEKSIQIVHPSRGNITEAVYGLGKVKSDDRFEVISALISTVTKRYVNEGDIVEKGMPLIELDNHAVFRAPFKGTVTAANRFVGETAIPNSLLLRIENLQKRYIELSLEQQSTLRVKPGQVARVSFESLRGNILSGKVTSVFPREDEFIARISVDGLDPSILPGMSADITIEVGRIENALLIPINAISNGFVTVRKGNQWKKIKLELGHIDGLNAEVKGNSINVDDEIRLSKGK
tara:strand:- start:13526 stop:14299 length:774 start_codon:yes stop_codon:yes gene_type:complete